MIKSCKNFQLKLEDSRQALFHLQKYFFLPTLKFLEKFSKCTLLKTSL